MTVKELTSVLENIFPLNYAEGFDNTGLLVGSYTTTINKVLITLDTTENVVDEAIEKGCNLIVSFHPIIFTPIKKITGRDYVERIITKAIKNDISIFALHTAMDNALEGVNKMFCDVLGLKDRQVLIPKKQTIRKLITYIPIRDANTLRASLFAAGAGSIGNYKCCSFNSEGVGSFEASQGASPSVGQVGKIHFERETRLEVIFPKHLEQDVLNTLSENHPYEEVAYEVITTENQNPTIGMGIIGCLKTPQKDMVFLKRIQSLLGSTCIRHSRLYGKMISKVAVLGGSGSFAIEDAIKSKADIFLTADISYHHFFKAEDKMIIADIGHYESEQYVKDLLYRLLKQKFPKFAVILSLLNTNPVNYLI